jgi:activator of 2-hydroxyglutaryl-CoA dehydratase
MVLLLHFFSYSRLPAESICIVAGLRHLGLRPDMVLSLGGESFVAYCLADGVVRRMISSNRCAAGSGGFLVQQFGAEHVRFIAIRNS